MINTLTKAICIFFFCQFALCGCARIPLTVPENELLNTDKVDIENQVSNDDRCDEFQHLSSDDWLVCGGDFYVKMKEGIYKKEEFPSGVHNILQEENYQGIYLIKEENRLIMECRNGFVIYDFATNEIKRNDVTNSHTDWQVLCDMIYYIAIDEYGGRCLMVYNMQSGEVKEIDVGEYVPLQFHVREDGSIGIWVSNNEKKLYCFWSEQHITYVLDEDKYTGWTSLRDYNQNGIILEREYQSSSSQGTKLYQIAEDGTITILNNFEPYNTNKIPEGELLFLQECILAIDFKWGKVGVYDYNLSYKEELYWDIDIKENMVFKGFFIQNGILIGLWENEKEGLLEKSELKYR